MDVTVAGETMTLHPLGALYWKRTGVLFISDLHLGKVSHFRRHGIGIPSEIRFGNLVKLTTVIETFAPQRVVFLGDLFHSDYNLEWEEFGRFLQGFEDIAFELVQGNHDIMPQAQYDKYDIRVIREALDEPPFRLTHEPLPEPAFGPYNLCGHIHPGVRLTGKARQSLRLPCFFFTEHQGILPAFGDLTGQYVLKPKKGERVYMLVGEEVVEVRKD